MHLSAQGFISPRKKNMCISLMKHRRLRLVTILVLPKDGNPRLKVFLRSTSMVALTLQTDSFSVEALAAFRALELAKDIGLRNVIVEGDALCIIRKLSTTEPDFSPVRPLIDDARSCSRHFAYCEFSHVPRNCNMVAHQLAEHSFCCFHDMFWFDDCPDMVQSLVIDDFSVSNE